MHDVLLLGSNAAAQLAGPELPLLLDSHSGEHMEPLPAPKGSTRCSLC